MSHSATIAVNSDTFSDAYQCIPLADNENDIIKFVKESKNTSGGDGDEFYELVLMKIIVESPWREDSSKAILLIADADPHEIGYTSTSVASAKMQKCKMQSVIVLFVVAFG